MGSLWRDATWTSAEAGVAIGFPIRVDTQSWREAAHVGDVRGGEGVAGGAACQIRRVDASIVWRVSPRGAVEAAIPLTAHLSRDRFSLRGTYAIPSSLRPRCSSSCITTQAKALRRGAAFARGVSREDGKLERRRSRVVAKQATGRVTRPCRLHRRLETALRVLRLERTRARVDDT